MYSHEIEQLLKIKHNIISVSEYLEILSTSPQINHVKYDNGNYQINTDDNYNFNVHVKTYIKKD